MIKDLFLNIFFPKLCLGCGKEGKYICDKCQVFLSESIPVCPVCGKGSFGGESHLFCSKRYGLDGLINIWDYEGIVKKSVHNIKYGGEFDIINELIDRSFQIVAEDKINRFDEFLSFTSENDTYVTFVPMFHKKEKKRGFNQAKLIADKFGQKVNCRVVSLLKKIKNTEDQAKLNKEQRLSNIKDSFQFCNNNKLSLLQIILIDDVFTTGATMRECARILKQAGIKKVWGFTLARTV